MEATTNQSLYAMLGAAVKGAAAGQPAGTQPVSGADGERFQELLERARNPQNVEQPQGTQRKEPPREEAKEKAPQDRENVQEEDPQARWDRLVKEGVIVPVGQFIEGGPVQELQVAEVNPETGELVWQTIQVEGRFEMSENGVFAHAEDAAVSQQVQTAAVETQVRPEELTQDTAAAQAAPEAAPEAVPEQTQVRQEQGPVEREETTQVQLQTGEGREESDETVTVEQGEAEPEPVFHDVKAAPIKVGETAQGSRTEEAPDVEHQLDARLSQALARGETRVELQLTPEHLGSVKVEITRTAEGVVHVSLTAQSSETRNLLEKHADGLRAALDSRTQNEVQVEVRRDEESQRQSDNPYEGHNGQARQQQEQRRQGHPQRTEDFLQQLRLGLIPAEDAQE